MIPDDLLMLDATDFAFSYVYYKAYAEYVEFRML